MKKSKKLLSLLLALVMLLSLLPVSALAAEDAEEAPEDAAAAEELLPPEEPAEEAEQPADPETSDEPPEEQVIPDEPETPENPTDPTDPTDPTEEEDELEVESLPEEPDEEEDDETELELASVVDSGTCGDFVNWSLSEEGILTITGKGSMALYNAATEVPWYAHVAGIKAVCIGEGVTTIAMNAFNGCAAMTEVSIPPTVKTIGRSAFEGCSGLTSITIPAGVTNISNSAFANCTLLEEIIFEGPAPSFGSNVFAGVTATAHYPGNDPTWTEAVRQHYGGTITWVAVMPVVVDTGDCGDVVTWVLTDDGVLTISGSGPMWDFPAAQPTYYSLRGDITSVVIEHGVTSIGVFAFANCTSIQSLSIPDSVTSIGNNAFANCSSLPGITIPDSVTSIGSYAFCYCSSLASATLPNGLTRIEPALFYYCTELVSVTIPDSVTRIGGSAFGRTALTSLTIPAGVTNLGNNPVAGCGSLTDLTVDPANEYYTAADGVIFTKDTETLVACPDTKSVYTVPDGCTAIEAYAFSICRKLNSITIPATVTGIGDNAFAGCSGLTSITIPAGVTGIGDYAFSNCTLLEEIIFEGPAPSFGSNVFAGVTAVAFYPAGDATWTDDVRQNYGFGTIIWRAVNGSCGDDVCWALEDGRLTIFGTGAMMDFSSGDAPWYNDRDSITSVIIESGVTAVGTNAFSDCTALTEIVFEGSAPSIGSDAFSGVSATAFYAAGDATWTESVRQNYGGTITWEAYDGFCGSHVYWVLDGGMLTIFGTGAMTDFDRSVSVPWYSDRDSIVSGVIESGVTSIGESAFYGCSALTSVTIPDSVKSIGEDAFYDCTSLPGITIPDGVKSIGGFAFADCKSLPGITIPDSVTSIGNYAFERCHALTSLAIPAGVMSIGVNPVMGCGSLTDLTVDPANENYAAVDNVLFSKDMKMLIGCPDTKSVYTVPDGCTAIKAYAFCDCMKLNSITIPDSCTTIEAYAFDYCEKLNSIMIPDGVTVIGSHAFYYCEALKEIVFEGSAPSIGSFAFFDVTATAYYPAGDPTWTEAVRQNYGGTITWVALNGSVTPGSVTLDQSYVVIASGTTTAVRLYPTVTPETWQGLLDARAENENGAESTLITVTPGVDAEGRTYIDVRPAPAAAKGTAYAVAFVPTGDRTLTARCRVDVVEGNPGDHPIAEDVEAVANGVSGVRLTEAAATVELYRTDYTRVVVIPELTENNVTVSALGPTDTVVVPETQENGGAAVTAAEFTDGETAKRFSLRVADDRTLEIVPTEQALKDEVAVGSSYSSAIKVTVDGQEFTTLTMLKISVKKSLPNIKAKAVVLNSYRTNEDTQPVVFTGSTVAPGKAVAESQPEWLSYDAADGTVKYTGAAGAAQKKTNLVLQVQPEGWAVRRNVSVAVSAKSTAPTVTFQTKTLTLKPATNDRAATAYTVKPALFAGEIPAFVRITEGSGKTAVTYENGSVLNVSVGSGAVSVRAKYVDGKAHTYTVTLSVQGKESSFKVKTLPENKKVTLSLSVKGNIDLAVEKSPAVITAKTANINVNSASFGVTKIVKKGDKTETDVRDAFGIAVKGNAITVTANSVSETGTYIATVQADCGGGVKAEKSANITVKKSSTTPKVSVKLKAAGSIDVLRQSLVINGNVVTLTPTVTNDYTYTLNETDITVTKTYDGATKQKVNENATAKFNVLVRDGKYAIAAKDGAGVSHADKYSVTATIDGVTSGAVALKVVQGKCKVTQDVKQVTLLHSDRYSRGVVTLTLSDPALKGIGDVKIVSPTDKSKRAYFDLVDLGGGKYAVVYNESLLPANVRALKTQTVKLQVFLEGNMTEKSNVTLSVKVNLK